jgi:hypothetical protein
MLLGTHMFRLSCSFTQVLHSSYGCQRHRILFHGYYVSKKITSSWGKIFLNCGPNNNFSDYLVENFFDSFET